MGKNHNPTKHAGTKTETGRARPTARYSYEFSRTGGARPAARSCSESADTGNARPATLESASPDKKTAAAETGGARPAARSSP
eukprot:4918414-Pyramimonas_sp.AAC.1